MGAPVWLFKSKMTAHKICMEMCFKNIFDACISFLRQQRVFFRIT